MWERAWKFGMRNVLKVGDRIGHLTGISHWQKARHEAKIEDFYQSILPTEIRLEGVRKPEFSANPYQSVSYRYPLFWHENYQISEEGLPLVPYKNEDQPRTNIVTTAQYGLSCYDAWKRGEEEWKPAFEKVLSALSEAGVLTEGRRGYAFDFDWPAFALQKPWFSALAQGQVISLLLRGYSEGKNPLYLKRAREAFEFLFVPVEQGGLMQKTPEGRIWLEEYPSQPPSLVLNGFVSVVIALLEMAPHLSESEMEKRLLPCVESLVFSYKYYDLGWWLLYDRLRYVPITEEYMRFQILQLVQLNQLLPMRFWQELSGRLEGYFKGRKWNFLKDWKGLRINVGL